jgi:GNAT superfamily N-acetyltransferase
MQHGITIRYPDASASDDTRYVYQQFRAFNDQQSGIFPSKDVHLLAYAPEHQLVGGLFGDMAWGWLHVNILWVAEPYRNRGIGTQLMDRAEAEAATLDVYQAYLETTVFKPSTSTQNVDISSLPSWRTSHRGSSVIT